MGGWRGEQRNNNIGCFFGQVWFPISFCAFFGDA